jgi:hypothetical protein
MVIECTDKVALQMAALAINASKPMGLGDLHYKKDSKWDWSKLEILHGDTISIDYCEGRMVKFHARKVAEGKWHFSDHLALDYQSWLSTYHEWSELHRAAIESLEANA